MKPHYKLFTYLTLFPLCIIAMGYIGTHPQTPPQTISITIQERDELVKLLTAAANTANQLECITVKQANDLVNPLVTSIQFLKSKNADTTKTKK